MDPRQLARAVDAAIAVAGALELSVDGATVLQNSNNVALRLLPCDVFARVAPAEYETASFEVELAGRLAATASPVAALEPRVEPRPYVRDGFEITLWTYYEPVSPKVPPVAYAGALARLHAGMRRIDMATQHFTDRVASAERLVTSPDLTPGLTDVDRELLVGTLRRLPPAIRAHGAAEQVLHGEPHPGNVLATASGPRFIDFETCCRGPVEFDLAHVPAAVAAHYPGVDDALLSDCRHLVLAMVAAWRWDADDEYPDGAHSGRELVRLLHAGPPWPALDEVLGRSGAVGT